MRKINLLMVSSLLSLLVCPLLVSAEVVRDQPVQLISFSDLLSSSSADESYVSSGQEEEYLDFFAGPVSEASDLSAGSAAYGLGSPAKPSKAKMKVLTCHITTSTTNTMKTIFPWVSTGVRVAHIAYFEILNISDVVKFKVTVQGPEFSQPLVVETLTFGPQEPLYQWGIGFWRSYSVPGLYKVKMTAIPQTNQRSGRSSIECSFRVSAPADN